MIHFRIRNDTLCGAPYKEPSAKAAKDGRLCNDCIQVMWREQYRRNTLSAYVDKAGSIPPTTLEPATEYDSHQSPLYLCDFEDEVLTI